MLKTRVGVLRGGPSAEYDVSLKSGQAVLANLPRDEYEPIDIYIDKQGLWHLRGRPVGPERALAQTDVVFNALHGAYGEDGTVQRVLDAHGVRYTGSGALASAIGMNKPLAKRHLERAPFKTPHHRTVARDACDERLLSDIVRTFPSPLVVKPADGGSSVATFITEGLDEMLYAIAIVFETSDRALVEEYVAGTEVTVGVVEGFRGEPYYALPPVMIVPTKKRFFDYEEKYAGFAREECPARLPHATTHSLLEAGRYVHRTLGLRDYSRSDFIVSPRGLYFLEVNTLPGLTEHSLVPKAVRAVGSTLPQFLDHVVRRALARP